MKEFEKIILEFVSLFPPEKKEQYCTNFTWPTHFALIYKSDTKLKPQLDSICESTFKISESFKLPIRAFQSCELGSSFYIRASKVVSQTKDSNLSVFESLIFGILE